MTAADDALRSSGDRLAVLAAQVSQASANPPSGVSSLDPSGAASVLLGSDGLPTSIRVTQDWEQRLSGQLLGGAVELAFTRARAEFLARTAPDLRGPGARDPEAEAVLPTGRERSTGDLLDALVAARSAGRTSSVLPTESGTGRAAAGRIVVVIGPSVRCTVDGDWATGKSAAVLSNTLGEALEAARDDLARTSAGPRLASPFQQILGDALATMSALSRPMPGGWA